MMFHVFRLLGIVLLFPATAFSQLPDLAIGDWRAHLSYDQKILVEEVEDRIYCGTKNGLFYVNKKNNSIQTRSPIDGLSNVTVKALRYHKPSNSLFIAYENGLVDVITDQKEIRTIEQINKGDFVGETVVNDFYFSGGKAYMAGTFGVAVYDIAKQGFKATYFGPRSPKWTTYDFTRLGSHFYASTENGLLKAPVSNTNLQDINNWQNVWASEDLGELASFEDNLYLQDSLDILRFDGQEWDTLSQVNPKSQVDFNISNGKCFISVLEEGIYVIKANDKVQALNLEFGGRALRTLLDDKGNYWYAINKFLIQNTGNGINYFSPDGPASSDAWSVKYSNERIFVAAGGYQSTLAANFNPNGLSILEQNDDWTIFNLATNEAFAGNGISDITNIAVRPDGRRYYATSYNKGLVEFRKDTFFKLYDTENSKLDYMTNANNLRVPDATFDENNNLWVLNCQAPDPLIVKTPENNWFDFNMGGNNAVLNILVANDGALWMRTNGSGIVVYDHNNTIGNPNDDQWRRLNEQGNSGGLPSKNVLSMAKDQEGNIWVGTDDGVAVFYSPARVFSQTVNAQTIFVESGGTSGNLLAGERVNAIKVDGGDYKWFGTGNGAFYTNPDGDRILKNFNTDNSHLLANKVNDIAINERNGEVFFATAKGLVSYRGEATKGGKKHKDVYAFPNPVEPGYRGPVTVKGLVANAEIKITDGQGNLVQDMEAKGGQVVWNLKNLHGQKVNSGVYYVYSADEEGAETVVTKILIIQ